MRDLSPIQIRQLLDTEQAYVAYRDIVDDIEARFSGSLAWKTVKGRRYLYRKRAGTWKGIGAEDAASQATYERFHRGRDAAFLRRRTLERRIAEMAPVNRALRLGRVPYISARLLRRLERQHVLGRGLKVAGTHALYAYERLGGVQFGEEAISTMDIDLLYDARQSLKLVSADAAGSGLTGVLQSVDKSFRPTQAGSFRAVNDTGFMVDLITPATRDAATRQFRQRIGEGDDELAAVEIEGLTWLENVPSCTQIAIDERGFPLTMIVPDPRAFACHKAWLSQRADRDPLKRKRDGLQARTLIAMLATRLPDMRFDDPALNAVPADVRALGAGLAIEARRAAPGNAEDEAWDR